jgi:hypothetical protein
MLPRNDNEQSIEKIMIPLDTMSQRYIDNVAIKGVQLYENKDIIEPSQLHYEETLLEEPQSVTKIKNPKAEIFIESSQVHGCKNNCDISSTTKLMNTTPKEESSDGFQGFADRLIAMD